MKIISWEKWPINNKKIRFFIICDVKNKCFAWLRNKDERKWTYLSHIFCGFLSSFLPVSSRWGQGLPCATGSSITVRVRTWKPATRSPFSVTQEWFSIFQVDQLDTKQSRLMAHVRLVGGATLCRKQVSLKQDFIEKKTTCEKYIRPGMVLIGPWRCHSVILCSVHSKWLFEILTSMITWNGIFFWSIYILIYRMRPSAW